MAGNFIEILTLSGTVSGMVGGLLALAGVIVNNFFLQRATTEERSYLERKDLYLHVTKVLAGAGVGKENTTEGWTEIGLWAKIVAPVEVQECLKEIVATNGGNPGRPAAVGKMCATMRKDLGVESSKSINEFESQWLFQPKPKPK